LIALDRPATADELYLARNEEVEPYRPILTGDVFTEITIPGVAIPHELGMVISHPCNMRVGDRLRENIQMLPIVEYQDVPLKTMDGELELRSQLREPHRVPNVRRLVRQQIGRRLA
jgi:hypothetical protein